MKILYKILIIPLAFFGLEQLIRTQTDGFRMHKIHFDCTENNHWDMDCQDQDQTPEVLNQPFYFLGSGVQCYAFLGADNSTILKVFKHYHLWPNSKLLVKIPLPPSLSVWRNNIVKKRRDRIDRIFKSALIARNALPEKTGTLYLNLHQGKHQYPKATIYDKIGVRHTLDLNETPFLLQKKADLIFSYLEKNPSETKKILDSLFACIGNRAKLGIANFDPAIHKNFGVVEGEVVEIDIGSFKKISAAKNPRFFHREIFYETLEVENWIRTHSPEDLNYFEGKRLEAINLS